MSLISEKTIAAFEVWAKENADKSVFPKIHKAETTYYINRNLKETYLMEYSFQNMAWLKEALRKYSGLSTADAQIQKELTVEICQYRFRRNLEMNKDVNSREKVCDSQKTLPEFVYVF